MIVDLIKELDLSIYEIESYVKIKRKCYASYDNRILIVGHAVVKGAYQSEVCLDKSFAYAYEFDLSKDCIDEVFKKIEKHENSPVFYKSWWLVKEHEILETPYKKGYCFLNSVFGKDKYAFEFAIKQEKETLKIINTPSFKQTLSEWISMHPVDASPERNKRWEDDEKSRILRFINDFDFLLLSEEKEIRDLYLSYKNKVNWYHCSCMSMDR